MSRLLWVPRETVLGAAAVPVVLIFLIVVFSGVTIYSANRDLARAKAWSDLAVYICYLLAAMAYIKFPEPNNQAVYAFPFVVVLIVVSARSQSLRPPAAAGIPYFKGQQG